MRITIIGYSGSGKTTLARKISKKFNIPHIHLDKFRFEAGGHLLGKEKENDTEWARVRAYTHAKVEEAIQQDSWVSDGGYLLQVQPLIAARADHIVFLDIPLWRRLFNHVCRVFSGRPHPELGRWKDFKFILEIIRRTWAFKPQTDRFLAEYVEKIVRLCSYEEEERYLAYLEKRMS